MYQKLIFVVIVASSLWTISQGSTPIRRCTEELPPPDYVQINDCERSPCIMSAGSTANITMQFKPVQNVDRIHAEIVAYINGDSFPVEIVNDYADVCKHLANNSQCPLKAGDEFTYNLSLPLDSSLSNIFVEVEFALVDENKNCVSCFVTDVRVN